LPGDFGTIINSRLFVTPSHLLVAAHIVMISTACIWCVLPMERLEKEADSIVYCARNQHGPKGILAPQFLSFWNVVPE